MHALVGVKSDVNSNKTCFCLAIKGDWDLFIANQVIGLCLRLWLCVVVYACVYTTARDITSRIGGEESIKRITGVLPVGDYLQVALGDSTRQENTDGRCQNV